MTSAIGRNTRAYFGSGGIVYGVIGNAHYFTLIFYSQVLGLAPGLAGMALAIGLVFGKLPKSVGPSSPFSVPVT